MLKVKVKVVSRCAALQCCYTGGRCGRCDREAGWSVAHLKVMELWLVGDGEVLGQLRLGVTGRREGGVERHLTPV